MLKKYLFLILFLNTISTLKAGFFHDLLHISQKGEEGYISLGGNSDEKGKITSLTHYSYDKDDNLKVKETKKIALKEGEEVSLQQSFGVSTLSITSHQESRGDIEVKTLDHFSYGRPCYRSDSFEVSQGRKGEMTLKDKESSFDHLEFEAKFNSWGLPTKTELHKTKEKM